MDKVTLLHWAEVVDAWRIFPRIFLTAMFAWTVIVVNRVLIWYMHLPIEAQSLQASGLAASIVTAVTGIFVTAFRIYSAGGRDWTAQQPGGPTT